MLKAINLLFACIATNALARKQPFADAPKSVVDYMPTHPQVDNSTFANVEQIATTHQHVDWYVNWASKTLQGSIILDMIVKKEVQYVTLDTWGNNVQDVHFMPAGSAMSATLNKGIVPVADAPLDWSIKQPNPTCG